MLPYFLRHYEKFCEKIFIRVVPSSDKTLEIAKIHPKVVLVEPTFVFSKDESKHDIRDMMEYRNNGWKKYSTIENCDWVIIVDCDEFVYHRDILQILQNYKDRNITFPKILGFQMYSEKAPIKNGQIYEEIKTGFPLNEYCKRAVFQPCISPNFTPGSHDCVPTGKIIESEETEIKLLHYSKQIFGKEALFNFWKTRLKRTVLEKFNEEYFKEYTIDALYYLYELTMKSYMKFANSGKVDKTQKFLEVI
jgi:hypothetical protein